MGADGNHSRNDGILTFLTLAPLSSIVTMKPVYRSLKLGDRSMYTLPPSDEVDAAWDSISSPPGKGELVL